MRLDLVTLADCEARIRSLEDRALRSFAPAEQDRLRDQISDLRFHRDRLLEGGPRGASRPT